MSWRNGKINAGSRRVMRTTNTSILLKFQVFQIDIVCSFVNISTGAAGVNRVELVTLTLHRTK